jgi:1,4-dihydroxy-2-naphthoate octaprenyltransferase
VVALVAVMVGTATVTRVIAWRAAAALIAALAIQVASNFANDYFDHKRGVDTNARVGPRRLTASGLISSHEMKLAIVIAVVIATLPMIAFTVALGPVPITCWVAAVAAAILYSGGPRPVSSLPLGEVLDFFFFGLFATGGAAYVHSGRVHLLAVAAAVPVGLLAASMLLLNNLRDIDTDRLAGRSTLAVLIGRSRSRTLLRALLITAFCWLPVIALAAGDARPLFALVAIPFAVTTARLVDEGLETGNMMPAFASVGRLDLVFGLALALGLVHIS